MGQLGCIFNTLTNAYGSNCYWLMYIISLLLFNLNSMEEKERWFVLGVWRHGTILCSLEPLLGCDELMNVFFAFCWGFNCCILVTAGSTGHYRLISTSSQLSSYGYYHYFIFDGQVSGIQCPSCIIKVWKVLASKLLNVSLSTHFLICVNLC